AFYPRRRLPVTVAQIGAALSSLPGPENRTGAHEFGLSSFLSSDFFSPLGLSFGFSSGFFSSFGLSFFSSGFFSSFGLSFGLSSLGLSFGFSSVGFSGGFSGSMPRLMSHCGSVFFSFAAPASVTFVCHR